MSRQDDPPPERGRRLIWERPERAGRGPVPASSRDQVAAAAVALADANGIEAVSMRKVASDLGVGAASLYRYVNSKDELLDVMVDWVEGEQGPPPELSGDWRADLFDFASRTRAVMLRHPWMTGVAAGRPTFGPRSLAWAEHGLAAMDGLDISIDDKLVASEILASFVRGFATRELAERQALLRAGIDAEEWARIIGPYITTLVEAGEHPRFARVVRDAELPHAPSRETLFRAALTRVLDGISPAP